MIRDGVFYVYWLSFKDGCKQLSGFTYPDLDSAVNSAKAAISFYRGDDVLSSDYPFYVECYEY